MSEQDAGQDGLSEVVIPKWGLTMESATLVSWLKNVGDQIAVDEPIAEIETDKADGEVESPYAGTVVELLVQPGSEVETGQPIARISSHG